jgi:glyoxylase-like metal-dependent hydrolase (beta-lactamase superfamily II)
VGVERRLEGNDDIRLDDDLVVIPVPGHTRGSIALVYKERFLFSGDHVWADEDRPGELEAGRRVCWHSWPEQIRSMVRLADFSFTHVLPGHGRRLRLEDAGAMRASVLRLADRMRA